MRDGDAAIGAAEDDDVLLGDWRAGLRHCDGGMQLIKTTRGLDKDEEVRKTR